MELVDIDPEQHGDYCIVEVPELLYFKWIRIRPLVFLHGPLLVPICENIKKEP